MHTCTDPSTLIRPSSWHVRTQPFVSGRPASLPRPAARPTIHVSLKQTTPGLSSGPSARTARNPVPPPPPASGRLLLSTPPSHSLQWTKTHWQIRMTVNSAGGPARGIRFSSPPAPTKAPRSPPFQNLIRSGSRFTDHACTQAHCRRPPVTNYANYPSPAVDTKWRRFSYDCL